MIREGLAGSVPLPQAASDAHRNAAKAARYPTMNMTDPVVAAR
jgi:hypothetical protein